MCAQVRSMEGGNTTALVFLSESLNSQPRRFFIFRNHRDHIKLITVLHYSCQLVTLHQRNDAFLQAIEIVWKNKRPHSIQWIYHFKMQKDLKKTRQDNFFCHWLTIRIGCAVNFPCWFHLGLVINLLVWVLRVTSNVLGVRTRGSHFLLSCTMYSEIGLRSCCTGENIMLSWPLLFVR